MLDRDGHPPGVPCWIDTGQPDPEAAVEFYGGLFGWQFEDRMPADQPGRYYMGRMRGRDVAAVWSPPDGSPPGAVWSTYIAVDDIDATATTVDDSGGTVLAEPFDVVDAGRMAVFADPYGAVFSGWQARTHKGAELVNEAGTWNWSDLNTRETEGSQAFYGAVFGWEFDTVDLGFGEATMIRRPGYAEFLERRDPGLRRRHAEAGAPQGFSDSIAWIMPMTNDQFADDIPPHWNVTVSVADADTVADRASALGGEVVTPPFDAGVVRLAVIRDPQGATFSISRYQPE